jgi:hypothetical protein
VVAPASDAKRKEVQNGNRGMKRSLTITAIVQTLIYMFSLRQPKADDIDLPLA